ncbi:bifunctional proline dehydrogenase/L-glutamate gamma-semialdehyde dehydrogenase PutA [Novosphingobium olei]|uniref:bifunctional proline dehydrogenase/L-glutamate gamma-semialdehyde dehydrogenase PutA n=1 Tax=Novosphingobium olei TaxID=2728851 RepID=UPI00308F3AF1|nr:trifunctional transcriptional regulator/proline dehydrogenase/L-glutamate gamma-semialdehyde dehydrogenase [Novosphingobium olei]
MTNTAPFARFVPALPEQTPLRRAIARAYRRDEAACVVALLPLARLPDDLRGPVRDLAAQLVQGLRAAPQTGDVQALVQEYALSSEEGVALMCLAEALLRIPDAATRDALIRDKIGDGDWAAHLGSGRGPFVNVATWGLMVTGKLVQHEAGLGALVARLGAPVIRRAVQQAMRLMGEQFVTGQTITQALTRARKLEAQGFAYSYDMLGEAATTAQDAARYYADYEAAIHAIGAASAGRGVYAGPGISIKLSALHPRYARAQAERVMGELLPRVHALALLARGYGIGFNIDAEEAERLELSLDLLEHLALDPDLSGWNGLGFVVQAYGKRCPLVIDWIVDLARRAGRRIMVRLVKGAYWDAEIKRAQVDGLEDFPVYTRKAHTDVAYLACAKALLAARDAVFPQFATHNAQTLASIYHMAGPDFAVGDYEFQCLHGMGEALYTQVVGPLGRPCRIYAPVGTHETLLAYLVRRLLENGANSSFVNRIGDPLVPVADLVRDPVEQAVGLRHEGIALPRDLYPDRANARGLDLSDTGVLADLGAAMAAAGPWGTGQGIAVRNPADARDIVGMAAWASAQDVADAVQRAEEAAPIWASVPVADRAACLQRAADAIEADPAPWLALLVREAGKSVPNAVAEWREAVDFLRYYAAQAGQGLGAALGPVVCISPWNFPLAIFLGQMSAALVAGNAVLAKPAEETPLIAAEAVRVLHQAGVPEAALQVVIGDGEVGAALVAAPSVMGVMFTGSTQVARLIQRQLAGRVLPDGQLVPFIAETGGQNAMIVDSSALAEQVVADVIASAFDSAGQRCSALRVLCLQEDIADRVLTMLRGAMAELRLGRTDVLAHDIGPVISVQAKARIEEHISVMRAAGCRVEELPLPEDAEHGHFVAPTIIEIASLGQVRQEVFGPVLHVLRYAQGALDNVVEAINATGYGLTFGLHTRLDATVARVRAKVRVGNIYVNRNMIGAVVGMQPFGGRGLSGTGPKAGGPLYLRRLCRAEPLALAGAGVDAGLLAFADWLGERDPKAAEVARAYGAASPLGYQVQLPGPVGESNLYALHPRGRVLMQAARPEGLLEQMAVVLATGNRGVVDPALGGQGLPDDLSDAVAARFYLDADADVALVDGDVAAMARHLAEREGAIITVHAARRDTPLAYSPDALLEEVSTSINTTAAGGNATLMMLGE